MSLKVKCSNCKKLCSVRSQEKRILCAECSFIEHNKNSKRICHHCGLRKISIKKLWGKLCQDCAKDPEIKEFYHKIVRDIKDEECEIGMIFPLPKEPTNAPPGSEEKIRILEKRAKERVQLFHPDDEVNINHLSKIVQVMNRRIKHASGDYETSYSRTGKELRDSKKEFHCSLEHVH